jgi:hypothetical protein
MRLESGTVARRLAPSLTLAVLAAFAHTGCGGTTGHPLSKTQYERAVAKVQQRVFAQVSPATIMVSARGGDPTEGLRAVQDASRTEAKDLADITPPADIAQPHRRLVAAIRSYAEELAPVITAVRQHKLSARALTAKLRSLPSVQAIRAARAEIARKGYRIG